MVDKKKLIDEDEDEALLGGPMPDLLADEDDDPMEDNSLEIDAEDDI